ncbi:MAG: hypothetical protein AAB802_01345 [Patescibacteria group bacterium]
MKNFLQNKASIFLACALVASFLLLHYFVYLENAQPVPILQSHVDTPVELVELSFCEEKHPNYLNPFRKIRYSYQEDLGDGYGDCNIIEQSKSIFSSELQPVVGDPLKYWDNYEEDGFARSLAVNTYSNSIFFILQYFIIVAFVFVLLRNKSL